MGQGDGAIERARRDLAEDRPWKARERLRSYLVSHPVDQPARELLGDVEWAMRDVPAAGAAWFLTTRDDERARTAIAVLRAEHPSAHSVFARLRLRAPVEAWPPPVQERLRALDAANRAEGGEPWRLPARVAKDRDPTPAFESSGRAGIAGCLLGLLATAGSTLVGVVTVVRWLADRLR